MPKYLFHLGNTPDLSYLELSSIFLANDIRRIHFRIACLELEDNQQVESVLEILGGTVKVSKFLTNFSIGQTDQLKQEIVKKTISSQKTRFALSSVGIDLNQLELSLNAVKTQLSKSNFNASYLRTDQNGLSAAVFNHKRNVIEFNLVKVDDEIWLSQTVSMQDIDDWTARDRRKPYFNRKKGMLPPKVARMMVNIALGKNLSKYIFSQDKIKKSLFDPFCGTGTVLMEAAFYDCQLFGSDLDLEAIDGAVKNMAWFESYYNLKVNSKIFRKDASQVAEIDLGKKIDLIVTEPYLGKPTPTEAQLDNIFKGLYKLYLGVFKNWTKLLNDHAKIVIVFPLVQTKNKRYDLRKLIDKLADFGYTLLVSPVIYSRKQAIVKRQIVVFEFNN